MGYLCTVLFPNACSATALYSVSFVIITLLNVIYAHFPFSEMYNYFLSIVFVRILQDSQESPWTYAGNEKETCLKGDMKLYSPLSRSLWSEEW